MAGAQEQPAQQEPEPGAGRVSLIHGDVSTQRAGADDWVAATVNATVVRGDSVSTGERSRTELELDYANILRLDQRTEAKIADLTRTHIQIQVAQGLANYTVLKGTEADVEIDTPNMAVHPLGEGVYRIQVDSSSQTEVTVRNGEAEVSTPQGSTRVKKNEMVTVRGTDNPEYQVAAAPGRDEWDQWNKERDHDIRDAQSWAHTNRYYTGAQDLDHYGHWVYAPGYGDVWEPYAGAGSIMTTPGLGGRDPSIRLIVRFGRPPLFRSSVLGDTSGSASDSVSAASAGCPSARVIRSSRGGAVADLADLVHAM